MKRKQKKEARDKLKTTYKAAITYECPIRGEVTEEVEIRRYDTVEVPEDDVDYSFVEDEI